MRMHQKLNVKRQISAVLVVLPCPDYPLARRERVRIRDLDGEQQAKLVALVVELLDCITVGLLPSLNVRLGSSFSVQLMSAARPVSPQ